VVRGDVLSSQDDNASTNACWNVHCYACRRQHGRCRADRSCGGRPIAAVTTQLPLALFVPWPTEATPRRNTAWAMYVSGKGVQQNYAEAMKSFRLAADQGNADAQNELGFGYANGQSVPQNFTEAVRWYRKAADQGKAIAQNNLGLMYATCRGVRQDYAEAMKWCRKAADQGYALAQHNVGLMYNYGNGVPQDYAEAAKWYRRAADQGVADAQTNLAYLYRNGMGVPRDYVQAHLWYNLAASRYSAAQEFPRQNAIEGRDFVASKMTPAELAEAQKLAAEWRPTSQ
jgi:uncharacterized protein